MTIPLILQVFHALLCPQGMGVSYYSLIIPLISIHNQTHDGLFNISSNGFLIFESCLCNMGINLT